MANTDNDIDLEKLLYRILRTIKRFSLLIMVCLLFGAALGYVYSRYTKKIYGSKMLISSYILTQSYANELVDNINLFIQEGDLDILQNKLNIPRDVAGKIVKLSAESGLEDFHSLDETERIFVSIRAQMRDPQGFKELEKGIVYYFENNEYAKKLFAEKKKGYQEQLNTIDSHLQDIELLRSQLVAGKMATQNGPVSIDLGALTLGITDLTEKRRKAQQDLLLMDGIQLVDGFTAFSEPQWPRRPTSIMIGIGLGFAIAFMIIIVKLISERMAKEVDNL